MLFLFEAKRLNLVFDLARAKANDDLCKTTPILTLMNQYGYNYDYSVILILHKTYDKISESFNTDELKGLFTESVMEDVKSLNYFVNGLINYRSMTERAKRVSVFIRHHNEIRKDLDIMNKEEN